jgi:cellulose synthase (UDP-forming)
LFGIKPLSAPLTQVAIFLVVCYGVKIYLFRKLAKKYRNFLFTDVYETAIAFYLSITVIKTIINPRTPKFTITSKDVGVAQTNYKLFLPQLILLIVALVSFVIPVYELYKHIHSLEALMLNLLLNLYNTVILIFAVNVALEKKEKRQGRRVTIKLQANLENYKQNKTNIEVMNISKQGALLFSRRDRADEFEAILEDENSLILPNNEKIDLKLIKTYRKGNGRYYNVKFDLDSKEKEDKLLKIAFKNSNNW